MPSTMPDTAEARIAEGLAEQLAAWDIVTYLADDATYPADAVRPLYFGPADPPNAPDERVLLTASSGVRVPETRRQLDVPVAILWRGEPDADPLEALNFLGLLGRRFVGMHRLNLAGVPVNGIRRAYAGTIPPDASRRPSASVRYLFRCREASAND